MNDLREKYVEQLLDIYDAEKQLVDALQDMADTASSIRLKQTFTNHLSQTEQHVQRLNEIFTSLDIVPGDETCERMNALIPETGSITSKLFSDSDEIEASLIAAAQRIEQFEIDSYEALCQHAEALSETDALDLLQKNLQEEKNMESTLTSLTEGTVSS
jgi:ferritin-like metal-binding protein YciE